MLYSAKYNFIYSKSRKTASTSVEAALEYLITNDFTQGPTNSKLYPDGSRIGYRGNTKEKDPNFNTSAFSLNHQGLKKSKAMLGDEKFNAAFKISSIRNPYDRTISGFHYSNKHKISEFIALKQNKRIDEIKNRFASHVRNNKYYGKMHFYCDSEMVIDKFVRMESIINDVEEIFDYLKVPKEKSQIILSRFPEFKKTERANSPLVFSDYYTEETLDIINKRMSNWFDLGNYVRCKSIEELSECSLK